MQSPCWVWKGGTNGTGYGQFRLNGQRVLTHRISYMIRNGVIAKGLEIDHLCRIKLCYNPDHLEAVTHKVNVMRGELHKVNGDKTHCRYGHRYDISNTKYQKRKAGGFARHCKQCILNRSLARSKKNITAGVIV